MKYPRFILPSALLTCFLYPAIIQAQEYQRRHNTIAHRILDFESTACDVTDENYRVLDHLIDEAVERIEWSSEDTDNTGSAIHALQTIATILDENHFQLKIPTHSLYESLTAQEKDGRKVYFYDCDTSSFIYMGIAEKLGLPLSFIEVSNVGGEANHNFVRYDPADGLAIDWDTNDKKVRAFTKPKGVYGSSYDSRRFHAYLMFLRGLEWKQQGEIEKAVNSYRVSMLLDPAIPHAANNFAWLFVENGTENPLISPTEALEAARAAVAAGRDPNHLDTLAGVYAETGNFVSAIQIQTEAVSRVNKEDFRRRLEGYRLQKTVRIMEKRD